MREEKEEHAKINRSEGLRKRAIDATADGRRKNRFGLRLAMLPAGVALLIILFRVGGGEDAMFVHWRRGRVMIGEAILGESSTLQRLQPGDWVATEPGADAVFSISAEEPGGANQLVQLGPGTKVLVINPKRRELRLEFGFLEILGPAIVQTAHGVLELTGRAQVETTHEGYVVSCLEGEAQWTGPTLVRTLLAGDRIESSLMDDALTAKR